MASGSTSTTGRPMESRTGRSKQRYNSKGERLVAGIVPLTADKTYVLLIQSTRRKGWVLPKGGWESDEECTEAAAREAWEEAGISIQIDYDLGDIAETRPPKKPSKDSTKSIYRFYEATVTKEETEWPEKHKRERQWFTYVQAKEALTSRPELLEALNRSTIKR
ncbi:NUDIX domain-containing protein [Pseudomassariella vexata]|uniref:NUDIX domain-containing protein n=1 Tax=Pseudomassariella vexata TaxID=1141098 RepID=A0A1Y2DYM8_9PEZI|nr:NUDIX domain-containing protein [Pseudomassariella vexata]ORY64381.1 NUDIX domain-containing protein [Pseudomassariella vexata]